MTENFSLVHTCLRDEIRVVVTMETKKFQSFAIPLEGELLAVKRSRKALNMCNAFWFLIGVFFIVKQGKSTAVYLKLYLEESVVPGMLHWAEVLENLAPVNKNWTLKLLSRIENSSDVLSNEPWCAQLGMELQNWRQWWSLEKWPIPWIKESEVSCYSLIQWMKTDISRKSN